MKANLIDSTGARIATLDVSASGGRFEGTIALHAVPDPVRQVFAEFEEIVEGQVLSLLDQVQRRIAVLGLRVRFADGTTVEAVDLQVFPSTSNVSFGDRGSRPANTAGQASHVVRPTTSDPGRHTAPS